jgi:hypothetical protein
MDLHIPIAEDLVSILDRVLDKSIVLESRFPAGLQGCDLAGLNLTCSVVSSSVHGGYGASWRQEPEADPLFAFWRRDLWTK